MRTSILAALTLAASSVVISSTTAAAPTLVELFSSEGCNSCPPADTHLHDLTNSAQARAGDNIFIAWHVDYWDHLGWKDPFGLAFATQRQRDYAGAMDTRRTEGAGVYTPQMIVAGRSAFVGSNRRAAQAALAPAKRGSAQPLAITVAEAKADFTLTATLPELPKGSTVTGVLIEDALASVVTAGENKGRTLKHDRVARAAATGQITANTATIKLTMPDGVVRKNASFIVFVQAPEMGDILALGTAQPATNTAAQDRYQTLAIGRQQLRYALILPDHFDPAKEYPAILALPPGGQDESMVEAGLARYWEQAARERGWIVVSPINPPYAKLFQAPSDPLTHLMDDIADRFKIEGGKFHLTGVSNGGRAAFLAALDTPDRFASLTVLPGILAEHTPAQRIKALSKLPVTMYAGSKDIAWVREAERSVRDLKNQGVTAALTVLEGEQHVVNIPTQTLFGLLDSCRP